MSKFLWILDAGHGGVDDSGKYMTAGKRAYFKDGKLMDDKRLGADYCEKNCDDKYYEGVGNRQIVKKVAEQLERRGIRYEFTVDPEEEGDIKLSARVAFINLLKEEGLDNIVVSVHSDAFSLEEAHGHTVYTSEGETKSDPVATVFHEEAKKVFPDNTFRTNTVDGDPDKESQFYILRKTNCMAILLENFFMTNPKNFYEILGTEEGQNRIVSYIVNAIVRIEKNGING